MVLVIFFLGRTRTEKPDVTPAIVPEKSQSFDIQGYIAEQTKKLPLAQYNRLTQIAGQTDRDSISYWTELASFWRDSAASGPIFAYYTAKAAKLDNSEKNLTFAAQLHLDLLRGEHEESLVRWETDEAIGLYEAALARHPDNEDLKIGLASCYIFGKGRFGDASQTMKGVQELLAIVRKDSTNLKAQLMLGVGGFMSGQYDKALVRLTQVVKEQPDNLEAVAFLADTYAAMGNRNEAVRYYEISKRLANSPSYSREVDERIKQLSSPAR